jgi:hypothetical protein
MKSLEEKKMIIKMARMFGQPVDQALVESIEREEKLASALFGKKQEIAPPIPILKEDVLIEVAPEQKPAETNIQPPEEYKVQQVANYLSTVSKPSLAASLKDTEFDALRKTVMDLLSKVNTLSWGGGGTGIVRIYDADDLDRSTVQEEKVVKWQNGMFRLDTVTGIEDLTYGSFSDTTNQTANLANTAYEVSFNTTDASKEHYIRNNTQIVSNTTGTFNYAFSMQITSRSSSLHNIYIWVRKNNTDIPNTATILSLSSNKQFAVAAWNFFVDMNAGDHLHLMWAVDDTRVSIAAPPATSFCPAVPSVILTVNEISKP